MQDTGLYDVRASIRIGYRGTTYSISTVMPSVEYRFSRITILAGNPVGFVAAVRLLDGRFFACARAIQMDGR
jgi:hypothetical protein